MLGAIAMTLHSCTNDDLTKDVSANSEITLTSDIQPFTGQTMSRANLDGNAFLAGDLIKVKIICPFASGTQMGESTYSNSVDGLYFMKATGTGNWDYVVSSDGYDLDGDHYNSNSPKMSSYHQGQQTPYVFTADTWSEERSFVINKSMRVQQTNVFHHDQHLLKFHLASDVLWAQTIMQTGGTNVHLSFKHKMACLDITLDDTQLKKLVYAYNEETQQYEPTYVDDPLSEDTHLTLEKMPNIDQCEIIVGNYYADEDIYTTSYGYRQKYSCAYEYNGTVIGVNEIDENSGRSLLRVLPGCEQHGGSNTTYSTRPITTDGVYTAYKIDKKHFRLMVPPCVLTENAVFWLRDGERRFSIELGRKEFKSSEMYPVTLNLITEIPTDPSDPID